VATELAPNRTALTVPEAAWVLSYPPNTVWNLIGSEQLKSFNLGRKRLVARDAVDNFIDRQYFGGQLQGGFGPFRDPREDQDCRRSPTDPRGWPGYLETSSGNMAALFHAEVRRESATDNSVGVFRHWKFVNGIDEAATGSVASSNTTTRPTRTSPPVRARS
jgi:excisionase family DNA binding protein